MTRNASHPRAVAWLALLLAAVTGQACAHDDHDYRGGRYASNERPGISVAPNGALRVTFRNDCIVRYDYTGRRRAVGQQCSDGQLRRADDVAAAHFRDRRGDGYGSIYPGRSDGSPEISPAPNGALRVTFRDDCVVRYDRDGRRRSSSSECEPRQVQHADAL